MEAHATGATEGAQRRRSCNRTLNPTPISWVTPEQRTAVQEAETDLLINEHELELQQVQEEADERAAQRVWQVEEQREEADERAGKRIRRW